MLACRIVATDVEAHLLERAREGRYRKSSLREVPPAWIARWFRCAGDWCELRPEGRAGVEFLRQDIRCALPGGTFDLLLCRNLAFTYFDAVLQRRTLERLLTTLRPGGALVIGRKERLPEGAVGVEPWHPEHRIYRRSGSDTPGGDSETERWKSG
jgi:chemotaxis protein methyltransferase CheR